MIKRIRKISLMFGMFGALAMLASPVDAGVCEDFEAARAIRDRYVGIVKKNHGNDLALQAIEGPYREAGAEFDKARAAVIRSIQDPGARALADKLSTSLALWTEAADSFEADYANMFPAHVHKQLVYWNENNGISISATLTEVSYRFACLPMVQ